MKKILVFLSCAFFLLPIISFGIFAEDRVKEPYSADIGVLRGINDSSYSYIFLSIPRSYPSSNITVSVAGYVYLNGISTPFDRIIIYDSGPIHAHNSVSSDYFVLVNNDVYQNGWDGYLYFNSPTVLPSSFIEWYNNSQPDSARVIDSGVTNFLSFGGQVLDFITSSEGILALLGLSIGLCLIVPFSIRKIKDFVKGY